MLYEMTAPQFIKTLKNLNAMLDTAAAFADSKKIDGTVLVQSRLIADQLPLAAQVQFACDSAKLGCARITGKNSPENADTEKTIAELKARVDSTISFLQTMSAKDFEGADARRVTTPRWEGKSLSGTEYVIHHTIPNFYFHVTTAYAILRSNGVDVGKKAYLGPMPFKA